MGREGLCRRITLASARSVSATLGLPPLAAHRAQALGCSAGDRLRPALGCMHIPGLSRSGSGTRVVLRGADSLGPAVCALPRSEQLRRLASTVAATYRLSLLPSFLGVPLAPLLRRMVTVQSPEKSQLAKKPACSLVDDVSLGLRLPPSGSGGLSPEGDGLQPTSSVQSFVL